MNIKMEPMLHLTIDNQFDIGYTLEWLNKLKSKSDSNITLSSVLLNGGIFGKDGVVEVPLIQSSSYTEVSKFYSMLTHNTIVMEDQDHLPCCISVCPEQKNSSLPTAHIGMMGGMGPLASARFIELLGKYNPRSSCFLINMTVTPKRPVALLSCPEDVAIIHKMFSSASQYLNEIIHVKTILLACHTAHAFQSSIPNIYNMLSGTRKYLEMKEIKNMCVLGTAAARKVGIFEELGSRAVFPPDEIQERITQLIIDIKKFNLTYEIRHKFLNIIQDCKNKLNTNVFGLFCTELPLVAFDSQINAILQTQNPEIQLIDPMEIIAQQIKLGEYSL